MNINMNMIFTPQNTRTIRLNMSGKRLDVSIHFYSPRRPSINYVSTFKGVRVLVMLTPADIGTGEVI